jgi:hypothetical protein
MAYNLNDKTLRVGQAFSTGGNNYPKNWLQLSTQKDRDALGITWEDEPVRADDTYYWNGELDNPKAMEDVDAVDEDGVAIMDEDTGEQLVTHGLKYQMTNQVNHTAGSILAQTDWYVIRKTERDVAIPAEVGAQRAHVVAESDRLETAIAGAADVEKLIIVMNEQNWENE